MKLVMIFLSCICVFHLQAQDKIEQFIKENTVAIKTIHPDSINYSDLEVIGNAIGDAKIVMLGEQDHGDAPTFLAKTRLIKYLHEKKGFDVLAFESDFFGLNQGWNYLDKKKGIIDSFLQKNIFPIWTYCYACSHLFYNYIPSTYNTENPLLIAGFDNQMILQYARRNIAHQLDSVLQTLQLPITKQANYRSEILPLIDSVSAWSFFPSKHVDSFVSLNEYLKTIQKELAEKVPVYDFWLRMVDNLLAETIEYKNLGNPEKAANKNIRDSQMAANLKWLKDVKYPDKKIIIWAANYHIAKYKGIAKKSENNLETMGSFFTQDSLANKDTYILGFTSFQGEAGRIGQKNYDVRKAKSNGFSNWIYSSKQYPFAFTDFTSYNQSHSTKETFLLSGFGHSEFKNNWTDLFNGIFYIQDMYTCDKSYQ